MIDMTQTIVAKSDQTNADDLIGGPITIKINAVKVTPGADQPVVINYENDNGKPWKPCKGMCRVLVAIWGKNAEDYIGKSLTLFREPTVKWAGKEAGGIQISHMEGMDKPKTVPVTVSRGKKVPLTVHPLQIQQEPPQPPQDEIDGWLVEIDCAETLIDLQEVASQMKEKGYTGQARATLGAAYKKKEESFAKTAD